MAVRSRLAIGPFEGFGQAGFHRLHPRQRVVLIPPDDNRAQLGADVLGDFFEEQIAEMRIVQRGIRRHLDHGFEWIKRVRGAERLHRHVARGRAFVGFAEAAIGPWHTIPLQNWAKCTSTRLASIHPQGARIYARR